MHRVRALALGAAACAAMAFAACGDDDDSGATAGATQAAAGTTAAAEPASDGIEKASIDVAAAYSGTTAGKADESLPPFKVGFVNQQGGTPSFQEQEAVADATVKFINEHLGGVDGHPLELDKCVILAEEDGQKCAAQLLNNEVKVANLGLAVVGNAALFKTVKGEFPFIVSGQGSGADVTTKNVYLLDPGGAAMMGGLADIASKLGLKKVTILSSGNPAGKYGTTELLQPAAKKLGLTQKTIFTDDTATTPDYASALQAGGAASSDAVLTIFANSGNCISAFDAMKQLNLKAKVISTYMCYGDPMPEHAGDALSNWHFSGFTVNPRIAADPQALAYRNVMTTYGAEEQMYLGTALKEFQDLLLITRFATELGYDNVTPEAMDQAIRDYRGPGFLVRGDLKCDGSSPGQPSVCGTEAAYSTFEGGAFVPMT